MNHHAEPRILAQALGNNHTAIKAVTYEYPGFWLIKTAKDTYCLGDTNGYWAWHNEEGNLEGQTPLRDALHIAFAFAVWLDKVEA
jgi:hypothetical protein